MFFVLVAYLRSSKSSSEIGACITARKGGVKEAEGGKPKLRLIINIRKSGHLQCKLK